MGKNWQICYLFKFEDAKIKYPFDEINSEECKFVDNIAIGAVAVSFAIHLFVRWKLL